MKHIKLYFYPFDFTHKTLTARQVLDVANHPDGWCKHANVRFVECREDPHVVLRLFDNQRIMKEFPGFEGFSVTRMDVKPRQTFLNLSNIQNPPRDYTGSHQDYLLYAVQHELGHAVFGITLHSKPSETSPQGACSTMYQQTRGTKLCKPGLYFTQQAIQAAKDFVQRLEPSSSSSSNLNFGSSTSSPSTSSPTNFGSSSNFGSPSNSSLRLLDLPSVGVMSNTKSPSLATKPRAYKQKRHQVAKYRPRSSTVRAQGIVRPQKRKRKRQAKQIKQSKQGKTKRRKT